MKMSNRMYDVMKWIVTLLLPALGSLYFGLSEIWNLPHGDKVVGTITLIVTFLSVVLKISNVRYKRDLEETELSDEVVEE